MKSDHLLSRVGSVVLAIPFFVVAAAAFAGGACDATCPVGAIQESDGCGGDLMDSNGGCNFEPTAYQDVGLVAFGSPVTVCGTVGTFGVNNRDLDWYRFSLAAPAFVQVSLTHETTSGFPAPNAAMFIYRGDDCDTQVTEYAFVSSACPFVSDAIALPAGEHVVVFTVNAFAPDLPACPLSYVGTITVTQTADPACGSGGSCAQTHTSPGCDDIACCAQVCVANPLCCELDWDSDCVNLAIQLCGVFIYECTPGGSPPNDCATAAEEIFCGDVEVAFDTSEAETDGPPDIGCSYGKDIWYLLHFTEVGGGEFQINVLSPTFDSTIAVYNLGGSSTFDPSTLPNLLVGCVDVLAIGGEAVILTDAAEGDYYLIQVAGYNGGSGPESGTGSISLSCRRIIFDTGNTSAVNFDSTNNGNFILTNLGWSSGNLNAANPQRWAAQAFTVPDPGDGSQWRVSAIHAYGFTPVGVTNQQLAFKIWPRTVPTTAPTGTPLVEGAVPFPVPVDLAGGGVNEDHEIAVDFTLEPGHYWLTVYGNNTNGATSNFSWFTNAQGGISYNLDGDPAPEMWRSSLYPTPGFVLYQLPATTLQQQAGLDPAKLYCAGFRILGEKADVKVPCPADLTGDGEVDGADLGLVLGAWNTAGADVTGDGTTDGGDLGVVLGSWGACP